MIGSAVATRSFRIRASEAASWATLATLVHDISSSFFLSSRAATGAVERRVLACVCFCLFLFLSFLLSCSKTSFFLATSRSRPSSPRNTARSSRDASSLNYRTVFGAASSRVPTTTHCTLISLLSLSHRECKKFLGLSGDGSVFWRESSWRLHDAKFENDYFLLETNDLAWAPDSVASVSVSRFDPDDLRERETSRVRNPGEACTEERKSGYLRQREFREVRLDSVCLENVESKVDIDTNSHR